MKIVFMHIPKTAGSSFMATLKEIYGERHLWLTPSDGNLPDLNNLGNIQAFSGHITMAHDIYKKLDQFVHLTILREPVARVIDAYNYLRECLGHPLHDWALKTPIKDALQNNDPNWGLTNLMTWHLSGLSANQADGETRLKLAKEALGRFTLFGFQEEYGAFIAECNKRMGWTAQVKWENVGTYKPEYGDDIRELIIGKNLLDIELYNSAKGVARG